MNASSLASVPMNDCPLCRLAALATRTLQGEGYAVACAHCGDFVLTDTARVLVENLPTHLHVALTRAVRHANSLNSEPIITVQDVATLVSPFL